MSIDLNSVNQPSSASERRGGIKGEQSDSNPSATSGSGASTAPPVSTHPVEVSISERARSVEQITRTFSDTPEIDGAKIDAIRQAIAEGRYPIDPNRLASNFLRLERDL